MAKIKYSDNSKCWWGTRSLIHCCWECKIVLLLWKSLAISSQVNMCLPYNTEAALGHLQQRNENLCLCRNLHANIHSSFICNQSKKLKKTICYSASGISIPWNSAIKTSKPPIYKITWMDHKGIMLSEKSPSQRLHLNDSWNDKTAGTEKTDGCKRLGRGRMRKLCVWLHIKQGQEGFVSRIVTCCLSRYLTMLVSEIHICITLHKLHTYIPMHTYKWMHIKLVKSEKDPCMYPCTHVYFLCTFSSNCVQIYNYLKKFFLFIKDLQVESF